MYQACSFLTFVAILTLRSKCILFLSYQIRTCLAFIVNTAPVYGVNKIFIYIYVYCICFVAHSENRAFLFVYLSRIATDTGWVCFMYTGTLQRTITQVLLFNFLLDVVYSRTALNCTACFNFQNVKLYRPLNTYLCQLFQHI